MEWDAIVIGSGIGGLTAAAALARCDQRVLVLEQHFVLGGMTQTFERQGLRFATGLHYIGGVGPQPGGAGSFGRLLGWLGDGTLKFAPLPAHFDTVRLIDPAQPGGEFVFSFGAPESDNIARLKALFPDEADGLDRYARDFRQATRAARQMFALHGLPKPVGTVMGWLKGGGMREAAQRTLAQALADIRSPTLRQLLAARGGDYGLPPAEAPLMLHATVMGSYTHGAWYPVGGPQRFAESLGATVRAAGGELRTSAAVAGIQLERGRACGVRLASGDIERARSVVSAMGAANTARALPRDAAPGWQAEIGQFQPSGTYVALFLGFEGDIRTAGIDGANHWIYETAAGPDALDWQDPTGTDAPSVFRLLRFGQRPGAHRRLHGRTAGALRLGGVRTLEGFAAGRAPGRLRSHQILDRAAPAGPVQAPVPGAGRPRGFPRARHAAVARGLRQRPPGRDVRPAHDGRAPARPGAARAHPGSGPVPGRAGRGQPGHPGRGHGRLHGRGVDRAAAVEADVAMKAAP